MRLIFQFYPSFETVLVSVHQGRCANTSILLCIVCNPVTADMRTYMQMRVRCISLFVRMRIVSRGKRKGLDPRIHSVVWRDCNRRLDVTGLTVPGVIWRTVNGKRPVGCNMISKSLFRITGWWLLQISRNSWSKKSIALLTYVYINSSTPKSSLIYLYLHLTARELRIRRNNFKKFCFLCN